MFRRITLSLVCLWSGALLAASPNIVLIEFGGYGTEWMGCYGGPSPSLTPHIDALSAEGVQFQNAWSMPKALVDRVTTLTGQYPYRHGWVNKWDVPRWGKGCQFDPANYRSFASILQESGYATAIAGRWQLNDFRKQPRVLEQFGFDDWCVWAGHESGNPYRERRYWEPYLHTREGSRLYKKQLSTDVFSEFIQRFIRNNEDKPYCVYYPMLLPYKPKALPSGAPVKDGNGTGSTEAMIRHADATIARIVETIGNAPSDRETVVIVTGSHSQTRPGAAYPSNCRGGRKLSDRGCGVPLIVRWKGRVKPGSESDALVDSSDFFPTILEMAGISMTSESLLDGRSFRGALSGDGDGVREFRLAMGGGIAVVVDGQVRPALEWAPRMIGDGRFFAVFERQDKPVDLIDLQSKDASTRNALKYPSADSKAALKRFVSWIDKHPPEDAWPVYEPIVELKRVPLSTSSKDKLRE